MFQLPMRECAPGCQQEEGPWRSSGGDAAIAKVLSQLHVQRSSPGLGMHTA